MEFWLLVVKQIGPTCGIYALINGILEMYNIKNKRDAKVHKIVLQLLKKNELEDKNLSDGKTFIGEFFEIDNYLIFIRNNYNFIVQSLTNSFGQNIELEISKISFSRIPEESEVLFIVPIAGKKNKSNQTILHWISVLPHKQEFRIIDSNEKSAIFLNLDEIEDKHYELSNCSFYWDEFNYNKIGFFGIRKWVKDRLKEKDTFLKSGILVNKIDYSVDEVIMIKKKR